MIRRLLSAALAVFRTNAPRLRPSWDDFGKASAGGIGFGVGHLLLVALGYALCGFGDLDPETFTRSLLWGGSWLVLHFAALVASPPKGETAAPPPA